MKVQGEETTNHETERKVLAYSRCLVILTGSECRLSKGLSCLFPETGLEGEVLTSPGVDASGDSSALKGFPQAPRTLLLLWPVSQTITRGWRFLCGEEDFSRQRAKVYNDGALSEARRMRPPGTVTTPRTSGGERRLASFSNISGNSGQGKGRKGSATWWGAAPRPGRWGPSHTRCVPSVSPVPQGVCRRLRAGPREGEVPALPSPISTGARRRPSNLSSLCRATHRPPSSTLDIRRQVRKVYWSLCPEGAPGGLPLRSLHNQPPSGGAIGPQQAGPPLPRCLTPIVDAKWTEAWQILPSRLWQVPGCLEARWAVGDGPRLLPLWTVPSPASRRPIPPHCTHYARSCRGLWAASCSHLSLSRRLYRIASKLWFDGGKYKGRRLRNCHQVNAHPPAGVKPGGPRMRGRDSGPCRVPVSGGGAGRGGGRYGRVLGVPRMRMPKEGALRCQVFDAMCRVTARVDGCEFHACETCATRVGVGHRWPVRTSQVLAGSVCIWVRCLCAWGSFPRHVCSGPVSFTWYIIRGSAPRIDFSVPSNQFKRGQSHSSNKFGEAGPYD